MSKNALETASLTDFAAEFVKRYYQGFIGSASEVTVETLKGRKTDVHTVCVPENKIGLVIGKQGKTIENQKNQLRTLYRNSDRSVYLEIVGNNGDKKSATESKKKK